MKGCPYQFKAVLDRPDFEISELVFQKNLALCDSALYYKRSVYFEVRTAEDGDLKWANFLDPDAEIEKGKMPIKSTYIELPVSVINEIVVWLRSLGVDVGGENVVASKHSIRVSPLRMKPLKASIPKRPSNNPFSAI